jgi:MFS family permease
MGRLLHGLSVSSFLPISLAASAIEGGKSLARRGLVIGLANFIGPTIGSVVYDNYGARASFIIASLMLTLSIFLVGSPPKPDDDSFKKLGGAPVDSRLLVFTGLLTIFASIIASYSSVMPVKLAKAGLPVSYCGAFQSTAAIISLVPRVVLAKSGRASYRLAALANIIALTGLVFASVSTTAHEMVAAGVVYGSGQGFLVISYLLLALQGRGRASLASSIFTLGWDIGFIIGPPVTGYLIEVFGYEVLTWAPTILVVNALALLTLSVRQR